MSGGRKRLENEKRKEEPVEEDEWGEEEAREEDE